MTVENQVLNGDWRDSRQANRSILFVTVLVAIGKA